MDITIRNEHKLEQHCPKCRCGSLALAINGDFMYCSRCLWQYNLKTNTIRNYCTNCKRYSEYEGKLETISERRLYQQAHGWIWIIQRQWLCMCCGATQVYAEQSEWRPNDEQTNDQAS